MICSRVNLTLHSTSPMAASRSTRIQRNCSGIIFSREHNLKGRATHTKINHYANFYFLRATDNLNKLDLPPDEWFKNPGRDVPPYTDADLKERLLTWEDLTPGHFESMLSERAGRIRHAAEQLLGLTEAEFSGLFGDENAEPDVPDDDIGQVRTDPQLLDAKRQEAINAFAAKLGTQFVRRSQTLFSTPAGDVRVCCAVSKKYDSPHQAYWYRYDRKWHEFLEGGYDSFFILCCMDLPTGFAIPFSWITEQKANLRFTERVNAFYWHIVLTKQPNGSLALSLPKKGANLSLTTFAFPIHKPERTPDRS